MSIRVYNTLTKTKETFQPVTPGKVGIYLCGPTVYKEAHIGHMVGPVIFDTIKRYLCYSGYQVTWVVNITDVDDKLIAESNRRGITMSAVSQEMTADYMANLSSLGVDTVDHFPKATEHLDEIRRFIADLVERGFAYQSDGDVYFEVNKDPEYGKLSNRTMESLQGEGGEMAAKKRSPADFALWKGAKPNEPAWDSPWGKGRPGWHIECSAMSRRLLGETFDIHGGGLDLVFPHHENEIAQSECCHAKPMVKYWMHNGLLRAASDAGKVGGRADTHQDANQEADQVPDEQQDVQLKMSRSQGASGLADLIARQGGEPIRFFLLRTHYRSTILSGEEEIEKSGAALETFYRFFERYERICGDSFYDLAHAATRHQGELDPGGDALLVQVQSRRASFLAKMDDDFNTGAAVGELFELVRLLNKYVDEHQLEQSRDPAPMAALKQGTTTLRELAALLGLFRGPVEKAGQTGGELVDKLMALLVEVRATARQKKDFATSDKIRDHLDELGITLEDRKDGTGWRIGS